MERLSDALKRAKRCEVYCPVFWILSVSKLSMTALVMLADQLLIGLARRLEACLRPGDTVARLGGDEFTILLKTFRI